MSKRKNAKRIRKPYVFKLSDRELIAVQNWQSLDSVSPKLAAVIDECGLTTVYERLQSGEYQAVKDGRSTKVLTASIKSRRANLPRAQFAA